MAPSQDDVSTRKEEITDDRRDEDSTGRRSYMKLLGAAATAGVGLGAGASAAVTRRGIQFDTVLDAVEDLGCDPNGGSPCHGAIANAAADDTLIEFPAGTYLIGGNVQVGGVSNFGMVGKGDVTFEIAQGSTVWAPNYQGVANALFQNIDVDQTADDAFGRTRFFGSGDVKVYDVTVHGSVDLSAASETDFQLMPYATSEGATVEVHNFSASHGGMPGTYRNGGGGCIIGRQSVGTVRLVDCHIEGYPNNGVYTGAPGPVQIVGGLYKNNEIAQLRLQGENTYVDGATVVVDKNQWGSDKLGDKEDHKNMRGIWWWRNRMEPSGGTIRNCEFYFRAANVSSGGIVIDETGGACDIEDSYIVCEDSTLRPIQAQAPTGSDYWDAPPKPHTVNVDNVSITGSAGGDCAINIAGRDGSTVANTCIQQNATGQGGIVLANGSGYEVRDSNVNVDGQAIKTENADAATSGITQNETCPVPGDDGNFSDEPGRLLTIEGDHGRAGYEVSVSGDLQKSGDGNATVDDHDAVDGSTASGHVWGGRDSYRFSGEITDISLDAPATVILDGEEVDPAHLVPSSTLVVESDGGGVAEYSVTVSGEVVPGSLAEPDESGDGTTVTGRVGPDRGTDDFHFSGAVTDVSLDGPATMSVDGQAVDPGDLATPNLLTIEGDRGRADYELTVGGTLRQSEEGTATVDDHDAVDGSTASGRVWGGRDSYRFSGDVTAFSFTDGEATVYLDRQEVDPGTLGQ